jgi:hypothetical protein
MDSVTIMDSATYMDMDTILYESSDASTKGAIKT